MLNLGMEPSSAILTRARVILFGASNLTMGIATVVRLLHEHFHQPLDIYLAMGHGRSYGASSAAFYRSLPGILECGIWRALEHSKPAPTYALLADIGNDLMYQYDNQQIMSWIEVCLQRLDALGAKTTLMQLPMESVHHATEWQFWFLRTLFFRNRSYVLSQLQAQAQDLSTQLQALAQSRQLNLVHPEPSWYGMDPIHIRRRYWEAAWSKIFAPWFAAQKADDSEGLPTPERALRSWLYLSCLWPEQRVWFGQRQGRQQPAGYLANGTRLFVY